MLYEFVKTKPLSNGATLDELLSNYVDPNILVLIKERIPTLTIFVPELPENSFSAEIWNVNTEIPIVAIRSNTTNDVPTIDSKGNESVIGSDEIPAFPIVVIKENERIIVNSSTEKASSLFLKSSNGDIQFSFLDEAFDNTKPNLETRSFVIPAELSKITDAYNIYKNTNGWQRDYIYYNITPTKTKGPFNYRIKEHLVGFEMLGNAQGALNKISDQTGDPGFTTNSARPAWTDGEFEFRVKVYIGNKTALGNEFITHFRTHPSDLFTFIYGHTGGGRGTMYFKEIGLKKARISLPLFEWDLENYSASIKIAIEEVDATETVVQTSSTSTEFANNFEFSTTSGDTEKIGMKFGSSQKVVRNLTYQKTTTYANDELGEVIVNFGDDIITSGNTFTESVGGRLGGYTIVEPDYTTKYSTGWYRLYIAPVKVK